MIRVTEAIQKILIDFPIKKKLQGLYILCVLVPLILTDGFILGNIFEAEKADEQSSMEQIAESIQNHLINTFEKIESTADTINMSSYIESFLNVRYDTALQYVEEYQNFSKYSLLWDNMGEDNARLVIYADNETILNGGKFGKISGISEAPWYKLLKNDDRETRLMFVYDEWQSPSVSPRRRIIFLRKMTLLTKQSCEKFIKIELDYTAFTSDIVGMSFEQKVYVCRDGHVVFTNQKENYTGRDFSDFTGQDDVAYEKDIELYGDTYQIYVMKGSSQIIEMVKNNLHLIIFLVLLNTLLPYFLMSQIEHSVADRIMKLRAAFDSEGLEKVCDVQGKDEIAQLTVNYNKMVDRIKRNHIREQRMAVAKKNAELLALQKQINPHFLFNALESIRMHSILKEEFETADMVEKLAVMHRQNVDWGDDNIGIGREVAFAEAYLGLQKYRFGDRLSYSVSVEEGCEDFLIPKLSIVTFVENACVHGFESKSAPGWIFVRVYKDNGYVCIEVEDTGAGMDDDEVSEMLDKMKNADIERLKQKERAGILNACLRLKMVTENRVIFSVESEKNVGTMIQILIPEKG